MCSKCIIYSILIVILLLLGMGEGKAQVAVQKYPIGTVPAEVDENGDTIAVVTLSEIYVFPTYQSREDLARFRRLVRDVKKTLPYAKLISATLISTYQTLQKLPNDRARKQYIKKLEDDLFQKYKPELKKMSYSQGRLLIKLIDHECNQTSYDILKAYLGTFRAGFWNLFAHLFGASLKSDYEPNGKDYMTERVIILVENGLI